MQHVCSLNGNNLSYDQEVFWVLWHSENLIPGFVVYTFIGVSQSVLEWFPFRYGSRISLNFANDTFSRSDVNLSMWAYLLLNHLTMFKIISFLTLNFFPVVPSFTCSDVGTETGLVASCQCFLRRNSGDDLAGENSHKFVKSTTNQVRTGLLQLKWRCLQFFYSCVCKSPFFYCFFKADRGLLEPAAQNVWGFLDFLFWGCFLLTLDWGGQTSLCGLK